MTPYKVRKNQGESDADNTVPSVSLFDFIEEVLQEPKRAPAEKKKTAGR